MDAVAGADPPDTVRPYRRSIGFLTVDLRDVISMSRTTDTQSDFAVEAIDAPAVEPRAGSIVHLSALLRARAVLASQLAEQHDVDVDQPTVTRLALVWRQVLMDVGTAVTPDLIDELARFIPRHITDVPNASELRVLEAELVGWIDGVLGTANVSVPMP